LKPLFVFISSAVILAVLAIAYPDALLSPGKLTKGHKAINNDCLACHTPFRGITSVQCIICHKQSDIGVKTVAGANLQKNTSNVLFHKGLADNSCIECHTDHKGTLPSHAVKPFRHTSLSLQLRNDCIACHTNQKPKDSLHQFAKGNCLECHQTTSWKPATFDHKSLAVSGGKQCVSCHKADQPADNMHRQTQASCGTCHSTSRWMPATFDHNSYYRLDSDHRTSCKTCHTDPDNYKKYTCYNCHEHSQSNIADQHREEGIYNYQNCMKCHRNGKAEEEED